MMALATVLITFTLTVHLQISFGQLNLGHNYGIESNKLAVLQKQAQKTNSEPVITSENVYNDNTSNVKLVTDADVNQPNVNKTTVYLNGNNGVNIKYLRNQAHNVPVQPSSLTTTNSNGLALNTLLGNNFRTTFMPSFSNFMPNPDQPNITAQRSIKYSDVNDGSISKSPLYITFGSPPLPSSFSQPLIVSNFQPMLSSAQLVPDAVKLQTTASPSQKQLSHQTFTSFHIQPTNVQNQAKLRYAHTPPTVVSTQLTTPTPDNTIQSRHSLNSLLLSHLLSQSPNVEDPSKRIVNSPNRNLKPSNFETLLPLLVNLLNERNNDCCRCRKYHYDNKCKLDKMDKRLDADSRETNSESDSKEQFLHACKVDRCDKLHQDSLEEEYYSDEISDYTAENYDDD